MNDPEWVDLSLAEWIEDDGLVLTEIGLVDEYVLGTHVDAVWDVVLVEVALATVAHSVACA